MNDNRCDLLRKIQQEDFAVYETALYLDTHPTDAKALEYYADHRNNVTRLRSEYSGRFGPLTIYDNADPGAWNWVDPPFPWEKEAN